MEKHCKVGGQGNSTILLVLVCQSSRIMLISRFVLLVLVSARIYLLPCDVQKGIPFSHSVFCCSISIHSLSGRLSLAPALIRQL